MTSSATATVVVELTPPGRGAVAVVVVAGPTASRAIDNCFAARSGRPVSDTRPGRIMYGRWGGPDGEEIVVCRRDEEQIEVHCHGGTAAVEAVIDRLVCQGCQRIGWQQWHTSRTLDPLRAAAQIALASAVTERTAAILLDQWNGALSAAVQGLVANIAAAEWSAATNTIDELLSRQNLGLHLTNSWHIVVFGAPNVGKSSLINALAGYTRTIVSPIPGTTRDVVTVSTAIEGWPVQLSDTAGFRETQDELESAGIKLATNAVTRAEIAIFVHDATTLRDDSSNAAAINLPELTSHARTTIHVLNKVDLLSAPERSQLLKRILDSHPEIDEPRAVSALNGVGVPDLICTIACALGPVSFPAGSPVPFTVEQIDSLAAAKVAIRRRDAQTASDLLHALLTKEN